MSPQELTVTINSPKPNDCSNFQSNLIQTSVNTINWIPAKPTPFKNGIELEVSDQTTCKSSKFTWTAITKVSIAANSKMNISLTTNIDFVTNTRYTLIEPLGVGLNE